MITNKLSVYKYVVEKKKNKILYQNKSLSSDKIIYQNLISRVFTRLKMSIPVKKSKESNTLTPLKSIQATTSSIQDILRRVWPAIVRLVFASNNQF